MLCLLVQGVYCVFHLWYQIFDYIIACCNKDVVSDILKRKYKEIWAVRARVDYILPM
jgi:hypothetical protein